MDSEMDKSSIWAPVGLSEAQFIPPEVEGDDTYDTADFDNAESAVEENNDLIDTESEESFPLAAASAGVEVIDSADKLADREEKQNEEFPEDPSEDEELDDDEYMPSDELSESDFQDSSDDDYEPPPGYKVAGSSKTAAKNTAATNTAAENKARQAQIMQQAPRPPAKIAPKVYIQTKGSTRTVLPAGTAANTSCKAGGAALRVVKVMTSTGQVKDVHILPAAKTTVATTAASTAINGSKGTVYKLIRKVGGHRVLTYVQSAASTTQTSSTNVPINIAPKQPINTVPTKKSANVAVLQRGFVLNAHTDSKANNNTVAKTVSTVNPHMKHVQPTRMKCLKCQLLFTNMNAIRAHSCLQRSKNPPIYHCAKCQKMFDNLEIFNDHQCTRVLVAKETKLASKKPENTTCTSCKPPIKFATATAYKKHCALHTMLECSKCDSYFVGPIDASPEWLEQPVCDNCSGGDKTDQSDKANAETSVDKTEKSGDKSELSSDNDTSKKSSSDEKKTFSNATKDNKTSSFNKSPTVESSERKAKRRKIDDIDEDVDEEVLLMVGNSDYEDENDKVSDEDEAAEDNYDAYDSDDSMLAGSNDNDSIVALSESTENSADIDSDDLRQDMENAMSGDEGDSDMLGDNSGDDGDIDSVGNSDKDLDSDSNDPVIEVKPDT